MALVGLKWRMCRVRADSPPSGALSLLGAWDDLAEREWDLGISPGQPFLLRPDGWPDRDVLAYFNSGSFRRLALQTQMSYATDLKVHLSFLASQGLDWRDATEDTFLNYEFWRRRDSSQCSTDRRSEVRARASGVSAVLWMAGPPWCDRAQSRGGRRGPAPRRINWRRRSASPVERAEVAGEVADTAGVPALARCGIGRLRSRRPQRRVMARPQQRPEYGVRGPVVVERSSPA